MAENRKQIFDKYANSRNFNPLVAQHWYTINYDDFLQTKVRLNFSKKLKSQANIILYIQFKGHEFTHIVHPL